MTKTEFLEKWMPILKVDAVRTVRDFGADVDAIFLQIQELQKALMCNCPICHYGRRCAEVLAVTGKYTEKR